ncbi:MAG: c-type cytochrome domain-containing protein, partial [Planctomycetia bacterium]
MMTFLYLSLLVAGQDSTRIDFKKDIFSILGTHCLECHSAEKQRGGLRLDRADLAMRGGDSGTPVLVPKKPEESLLIQIITKGREGKVMPPKGEK